jgi:hypothetical protein
VEQAGPDRRRFVKKGYGYAFIPEIGKDGFIFAGGGDHGIVYEQWRWIASRKAR